jgi:hypothetical protein
MRFRIYAPVEAQEQQQKQQEQKKPSHSTIGSDVGVPFLQAILTGVFISAFVVFLISEIVPDWQITFKVWFLLWMACSGLAWLVFVADTRWPYSTILFIFENVFKRDINKDGEIEHGPVFVNRRQAKKEDKGNRHLEDFHDWVRSIPVKGTSWEAHEPTMKRRKYEGFRNALLQGGWAQWKDPEVHTLGWELVEDPEVIVENLNE